MEREDLRRLVETYIASPRRALSRQLLEYVATRLKGKEGDEMSDYHSDEE